MKVADELLMAYADGELDPSEREAIEAIMATDPAVALAVERHRALRLRVATGYESVLNEAVPPQLTELLQPRGAQSPGSLPPAAPVVDLSARRMARDEPFAPRRFALPQWAAMAASLLLGLFIGVFGLRGTQAPYQATAGKLLAQGDLAAALDGQLASDAGAGPVRVGVSFRERGGSYCRTFSMRHEAVLAGLACRDGEDWSLRLLAPAADPGGELRTAAALPLAILQAVDAAIDGEPLDAAAEAAAREAGWQ